MDAKAVSDRITAYLSSGGLFNPELADHYAVRDLLIDARAQLDLLASVEGSGEEIVREGESWAQEFENYGRHSVAAAFRARNARIVSDAQEKERLRAELASVRAVVEIAEKFGKPGGDFAATLIITELLEAVAAHRAAHPKDAP